MKNKKQLFMTLLMTAVMTFGGTATQKAWGETTTKWVTLSFSGRTASCAATGVTVSTDMDGVTASLTSFTQNGTEASLSDILTGTSTADKLDIGQTNDKGECKLTFNVNGLKGKKVTDIKFDYFYSNSSGTSQDRTGVGFTYKCTKGGSQFGNDLVLTNQTQTGTNTTTKTFTGANPTAETADEFTFTLSATNTYNTGTYLTITNVYVGYEVPCATYTVQATDGNNEISSGGVIYNGTSTTSGNTFSAPEGLTDSDLTAIAVAGYFYGAVSVSGTEITVTYYAGTEVRPTYISTNDTKTGTSEIASHLVDDSGTSTKWCTTLSSALEIIVKAEATILKGYDLYNGNDTQSQQGRRWKNWKIEGSCDNKKWTIIESYTNHAMDNTDNYGKNSYLLLNNTTAYNYYKITIASCYDGTTIQMSDLKFFVENLTVTYNYTYGGEQKASEQLVVAAGSNCPEGTKIPYGCSADYTSVPSTINETATYYIPVTTANDYPITFDDYYYIIAKKQDASYNWVNYYAYYAAAANSAALATAPELNVDKYAYKFDGSPFGFRIVNKGGVSGNQNLYQSVTQMSSAYYGSKFQLNKSTDGYTLIADNNDDNYQYKVVMNGASALCTSNSADATYANLAFESILSSTTLTLNDGGDDYYYATAYYSFPVQITGATAFRLNLDDDTYNCRVIADGKIPAETAVIVRGTTSSATISYCSDEIGSVGINKLHGTLAPTKFAENTVMTLYKGDSGIGFYMFSEDATLGAHKAYILAEVAPNEIKFNFEDDTETGINNVDADVDVNANTIYNLAGQRVNGLQKGINIVNGKKVLY